MHGSLAVIPKDYGHDVPLSVSAVMGTPHRSNVIEMAGGEYGHLNNRDSILKKLERVLLPNEKYSLQICVDGVSINKSSSKGLWLIYGGCVQLS